MKYFLDTNICIYFLKGLYPDLQEYFLKKSPIDLKIPAIVKAELLYGAEKSERRKYNMERVKFFLFPFEIIYFDNQASEIYAKIRSCLEKRGNPIGPNDLIIASTVLAHEGILVTNNVKEFGRVPKLKIENWTKR